MDSVIQSAIDAWLNDAAIADTDKQDIRDLFAAGDEKELTDRFYRELEFGTGGMRGTIGAGLNRMNVYTVGAAAQGLANYIASQGQAAKDAGIAIAYDCRRKSDLFSERVARVMAANGIKAYLFEELRPTPELSFAVRHLGCTAGVVVTASHNPPEYNGFKAYWSDGVQVVPPHDIAILDEVRNVGGFANVTVISRDDAIGQGLLEVIGREVDEAFLEQVDGSCINPELSREQGKKLKIVFTGLHGTGSVLVPEALKRRGFVNTIEVPEQRDPDSDFPTVASPNPEEGAALTMGIELARRENADLVIGTDPDADRVGIAVRGPDGDFVLITGNQIGALLTWYICEELTKANRFPGDAALVTTIVSGGMMKTIARSYGADVIETLTGFKWIGEKVSQFETDTAAGKPSKTYIFGAEESYGYMPSTFVRDKDAVTSAVFIADLAAAAAARGQGLCDLLQALFKKFGTFVEGAKSLVLKGADGAAKIQAMMDQLRNDPPKTIGNIVVKSVADIMTGDERDIASNETVKRFDLPSSNVILFTLADGTQVIARPSGTEPKIKFYVLTSEPGDDIAKAQTKATVRVDAIIEDLVARAD